MKSLPRFCRPLRRLRYPRVAAMYILFLAWVPVIRIIDAAFGWMRAHDTATSVALAVVFVGVLVAIWRKD